MKKREYIELLLVDNKTSGAKKKLYSDVIDCTEIALSQTDDNFEIDDSIGLETLFGEIEKVGRESKCVGPFEAAELIAKTLGTKYERATRKFEKAVQEDLVNLEDFL